MKSSFKKLFFKLSYIYLLLEKLVKKNLIKKKFSLVFIKVFFFLILGGKYYIAVVKNLKICYCLLIILNLVLNLLIVIYFILNFFNYFLEMLTI
jgi:hypothetical protein